MNKNKELAVGALMGAIPTVVFLIAGSPLYMALYGAFIVAAAFMIIRFMFQYFEIRMREQDQVIEELRQIAVEIAEVSQSVWQNGQEIHSDLNSILRKLLPEKQEA